MLASAMLASALTAQHPDSTKTQPGPPLERRDVLVAAGIVAATLSASALDRTVDAGFHEPGLQSDPELQRLFSAGRFAGGPAVILLGGALYATGRVVGSSHIAATGLNSLEAMAVGSVASGAIKLLVGRARPVVKEGDSDRFVLGRGFTDDHYRRFPSGHTTVAFAAATSMTMETAHYWPRATWRGSLRLFRSGPPL